MTAVQLAVKRVKVHLRVQCRHIHATFLTLKWLSVDSMSVTKLLGFNSVQCTTSGSNSANERMTSKFPKCQFSAVL